MKPGLLWVRRCCRVLLMLQAGLIGQLTTEDLRLLIGQAIGLEYLIPLAIEILRNDPLAEGDFYPGDLLKSVLSVNESYWSGHTEQKVELLRIAEPVREQLRK